YFLSLATGYTISKCEMTGVVMYDRDGATHVVPVADGYVIGSSIKSIPCCTLFVQKFMRERGEHIPPEDSLEVAHKVKEVYCYTYYDIVKLIIVGSRFTFVCSTEDIFGASSFSSCSLSGLYISMHAGLALATRYTIYKFEMTGVVMDAGDGATHVVPVAVGYVIGSSIKSIPI
ncbi:hypothetical protein KI387_021817, partial [Taxus chinensis]